MTIYDREGGVLFVVINDRATDIIPDFRQNVKHDDVTAIHVPSAVTYHPTWYCYNLFPNLLNIIASPNSTRYISYDGALYTRDGSLCYVPIGRSSIELAPFMKRIDYHAFYDHDKLTGITIAPGNEAFEIQNGCLYSKGAKSVYHVFNSERRLFIPKETNWISEDVLAQDILSIVVDKDNPHYQYVNGMLVSCGHILYVLDPEQVCIPLSVTEIRNARELFRNHVLSVEEGHPVFRVEDGVVFNLRTRTVVYVSNYTKTLYIPDDFSLDVDGLLDSFSLEKISVPCDSRITRDAFAGADHLPSLEVEIRFDDGFRLSVPHADRKLLYPFLSLWDKPTVEVKKGRELYYLELFLGNRITDPVKLRQFYCSAYQILEYLILQNDLDRLRRVAEDSRLITKKNISRLIRFSHYHGKTDIEQLLTELKSRELPEHYYLN